VKKVFRVSEVARKIGRSERWLRQTEIKGKIPKARRDINNWRVYSEEEVATIEALINPVSNEK
jgi:DNA-binding transcriptional MerR regulator